MTIKFPIWITIVLGLQMLLAMAACAFALILGSAFSGELPRSPLVIAMIAAMLLPPVLCYWLSRRQWRAEKFNTAKLLAFGPFLLYCVLAPFSEFIAR